MVRNNVDIYQSRQCVPSSLLLWTASLSVFPLLAIHLVSACSFGRLASSRGVPFRAACLAYPYCALRRSSHLLNPLLVLSLAGKSGSVYEVNLVLLAMYAGWRGHALLAIVLVAVSAQLGVHNAFFIAPVLFMGHKSQVLCKLLLFGAAYAGLTLLAFRVSKSQSLMGYVECTVGCHVFIHDLRPNIGLWWYMFIEMFDHFRALFLGVFQLLPWAFVVPGAVRLGDDPLMLAWFIAAVLSITKPYPTVSEVGLSVQLLLLHPVLLDRCRRVLRVALIVGGAIGYLLPIVWYYWMVQGSGNSNFYYAATLAANATQMVVCVCVVAEYMKMQVESRNPEVQGASGKLYQK